MGRDKPPKLKALFPDAKFLRWAQRNNLDASDDIPTSPEFDQLFKDVKTANKPLDLNSVLTEHESKTLLLQFYFLSSWSMTHQAVRSIMALVAIRLKMHGESAFLRQKFAPVSCSNAGDVLEVCFFPVRVRYHEAGRRKATDSERHTDYLRFVPTSFGVVDISIHPPHLPCVLWHHTLDGKVCFFMFRPPCEMLTRVKKREWVGVASNSCISMMAEIESFDEVAAQSTAWMNHLCQGAQYITVLTTSAPAGLRNHYSALLLGPGEGLVVARDSHLWWTLHKIHT